jgi:nucleoside-diphosphate-sugar epimerase
MPLIVVGADTPSGRQVLDGLTRAGAVRAFVSDESESLRLRESGVKVALGDVSDDGHVETASWGCFSAVLVAEAAEDDRERSFARNSTEVLAGWARAVSAAGVKRVIWVLAGEPPAMDCSEVAAVDPAETALAAKVAALDAAQSI